MVVELQRAHGERAARSDVLVDSRIQGRQSLEAFHASTGDELKSLYEVSQQLLIQLS